MHAPTLFLLVATLLPLIGFGLLLFMGRRMGNPFGPWTAGTLSVASFAATLIGMVKWYIGKQGEFTWGYRVRSIRLIHAWLPAGTLIHGRHAFLDCGLYVDSLTIAMFAMVTVVSAIVHVFCVGSMRREPRFVSFFASLGLLCFAMLGFVLSGTLLQMFVFWQLIGVVTSILISGGLDRAAAGRAALRMFITQRIGDGAFLIGLGILISKTGGTSLVEVWTLLGNAAGGHAVILPDGQTFSTGLLSVMGIAFFCAAIARAAQFPLQFWLADVSKGHAPAGAMICSAVTVTAAVYFIARLYPLFTPDVRLFIAIVGIVTLTMAAMIALVQDDILRLLAWASVSQVGYMMLAIGVGSWMGGLFHLMTHAFFGALLFLGAAGVMASMKNQASLQRMGGLWTRMPVTDRHLRDWRVGHRGNAAVQRTLQPDDDPG